MIMRAKYRLMVIAMYFKLSDQRDKEGIDAFVCRFLFIFMCKKYNEIL